MEKKKKLSINIILFAISSFGTKFLSFVLVPFYTNYLSTSEYGTIDIIITTASLLMPIFTLTVYDGVMRFTLTDKTNNAYLKIGIRVSVIGSVLLALLLSIVSILFREHIEVYLLFWIWIVFACNISYSMVTNYLRAIDKVSIMVQGSLINSLLLLPCNIYFIAVLHYGVTGYFISTVIGLAVSVFYMIIRGVIPYNKKTDVKSIISAETTKELLIYSIPLIFTAIAWWINSGLDRYFVTAMCGIAANGVYSIAYKIPNLLTAFQTVFTQAWSISAVTEFDKDDRDGFMGQTYQTFNMLMLMACMGIILLNIPLSKILYAKEFYEAWQYVPFLLCATLFGALAGYFGGIFAAVKDSKICAVSTMIGALVNIILNALMIPVGGAQGAAVATLFAYFVSWAIRAFAARKYVKLKTDKRRIVISYILLVIQLVCSISANKYYVIQVAAVAIVILLNKDILINLMRKMLKIKK